MPHRWEVEPLGVEGERHLSWALHLPLPRTLLASGLVAGLTKPPLQHPRHSSPGCMAKQGEQARRPLHGKARDGVDAPLGKGEQVLIGSKRMRPSRGSRRDWACREGLGKSATEQRALTSGGCRGRIHQCMEKSDLTRGTHKLGTVGRGRACRMFQCGGTGNDRSQPGNRR